MPRAEAYWVTTGAGIFKKFRGGGLLDPVEPVAPVLTYPEAVMAQAPAAYWRFEELTGTTLADASGNAHTGTIQGAPLLDTNIGLINLGSAANFNGVNTGVTIPYSAALNPAKFTIVLWMNREVTASDVQRIISSRPSTGFTGYDVWCGDSNISVSLGNGVDYAGFSAVTPLADQSKMLVITYDGATIRVLVDMVQIGTAARTGFQPNTTNQTTIARRSYDDARHFLGTLDEPAIFGRVLTDAQLQSIYDASGKPPVPPAGTLTVTAWEL